jgi:two-component system, NarL family, nitrate/nitrite response regulator NarL
LVRWGLERLVRGGHPHYEAVGGAQDLPQALEGLQRLQADVVVLVAIGRRFPTVNLAEFCAECGGKVLLVTGVRDQAWLDSAVMVGVRGIIATTDAPRTLLRAVEKLQTGELWIDRVAVTRILMEIAKQKKAELNDPERAKIAKLTVRERQMIAAVASDASASGSVLAKRLCISEHTVRNHLSAIYHKLGLDNKLDLYAYARRYGLHENR